MLISLASILSRFYKVMKGGWRMPFDPDRQRGMKPGSDLVNAKTGKVVVEAGRKITARLANKLASEGVKDIIPSANPLAPLMGTTAYAC